MSGEPPGHAPTWQLALPSSLSVSFDQMREAHLKQGVGQALQWTRRVLGLR